MAISFSGFDLWDALGAGANLIGGFAAKSARDKAAKQQVAAQQQAIGAMAPYSALGSWAAPRLRSEYTSLSKPFTMADFRADPGYQFRLREGLRAQRFKENAGGKLYSTAALRAGQRYGQGLASQEYQSAWARDDAEKRRRYNMLAQMMGAGASASGFSAPLYTGIGDARSAATIGGAGDIWGGVRDALNVLDESRYRNTMPNIFVVPV